MYKLPEDLKSKYAFVTMASARAEQLQTGAVPRVECESKKLTVIAQAEVATGAVEEWEPTDEFEEGIEEAEVSEEE